MDLFIIYSAFQEDGTYYVVEERTMFERTKLNELSDDYAEYKRAEPELEAELLQVYKNGGAENYEVTLSPSSSFLVAMIKQK